jgi:hypothetical protein
MSGPGLGRGRACALGPRETMVAANKAALAWVPGGIGALQGVGWGPEFRVVTRARARAAPL